MSFVIEKDQYTVTTTTECNVVAQDDKVTSQIWLRTPVGFTLVHAGLVSRY
jgi:hypothetical protein